MGSLYHQQGIGSHTADWFWYEAVVLLVSGRHKPKVELRNVYPFAHEMLQVLLSMEPSSSQPDTMI